MCFCITEPSLSCVTWCRLSSCALICSQVTEKSTLELATGTAPIVKLDDKHYKLVDKMEALTLRAPSLVGAKALTVKGPVKFVPGTTIKGEVTITNGTHVGHSGRRLCSCFEVWCCRLGVGHMCCWVWVQIDTTLHHEAWGGSGHGWLAATHWLNCPSADTGKPIALKEGTYSDQTVELKPSSTPEPQTGGMQPAYA